MKKQWLWLVLLAILALAIAGCVPGGGSYTAESQAGFLSGIWHGWIAPISLVMGLFNNAYRVYEPHNTGWWYDFAFYLAIIGGFGGISLSRRKK